MKKENFFVRLKEEVNLIQSSPILKSKALSLHLKKTRKMMILDLKNQKKKSIFQKSEDSLEEMIDLQRIRLLLISMFLN